MIIQFIGKITAEAYVINNWVKILLHIQACSQVETNQRGGATVSEPQLKRVSYGTYAWLLGQAVSINVMSDTKFLRSTQR